MDNFQQAKLTKERLDQISPTMCMAKWLQVSLHLPQGRTHSCYHPPTHKIPLEELYFNKNALHNTKHKMLEREQMKRGEQPTGCQYCWNVENQGNLSDRHYRSGEWWAKDAWEEVVNNSADYDIKPRYVEVNFNQACNFKCSYCSPHLSTAWEEDIRQHGDFEFSSGKTHNNIENLTDLKLMPQKLSTKENPYVDAFWEWFPTIADDLKVFRMTGGEPLMDKNTFRVLDYFIENPNPGLELSITSNMCPPDPRLFDKFLNTVKSMESDMNDNRIDEWLKTGEAVVIKYLRYNKWRTLDMPNNHHDTWPTYIILDDASDNIPEIQRELERKLASEVQGNFTENNGSRDPDTGDFIYELLWIKPKGTQDWYCLGAYEDNKLNEQRVDRVRNFTLFVSVDSWGEQAEYIRDGLHFETLKKNVERILSETRNVNISFINTFSLLSVPGLKNFMQWMLDLRKKYNADAQQQLHNRQNKRIEFDTPYLRDPRWMTIELCDQMLRDEIYSVVRFMEQHKNTDTDVSSTFEGFYESEIAKLKRDLEWAQQGANQMSQEERSERLVEFYEYFTEYDRRRKKDFLKTFPSLIGFMHDAQAEADQRK